MKTEDITGDDVSAQHGHVHAIAKIVKRARKTKAAPADVARELVALRWEEPLGLGKTPLRPTPIVADSYDVDKVRDVTAAITAIMSRPAGYKVEGWLVRPRAFFDEVAEVYRALFDKPITSDIVALILDGEP